MFNNYIWQQKWRILFWAFLGLVTFLLLIELAPKPPSIPYLDKFEHAFVFAILYVLGMQAYKPYPYWLAGALILYGGIMEPIQSFCTLTRQGSVYDWLADIAGLLLAMLLMKQVAKYAIAR